MIKNKNRKGFTIVELVIVIAVIAILAAVLIPTFASVIKKANESADIQAARQMNTALAAESITDKPETFEEVIEILSDAGFNTEKALTPTSSDLDFYWYQPENVIVLATKAPEVNAIDDETENPDVRVLFPNNDDELVATIKELLEQLFSSGSADGFHSFAKNVVNALENLENGSSEPAYDPADAELVDKLNAWLADQGEAFDSFDNLAFSLYLLDDFSSEGPFYDEVVARFPAVTANAAFYWDNTNNKIWLVEGENTVLYPNNEANLTANINEDYALSKALVACWGSEEYAVLNAGGTLTLDDDLLLSDNQTGISGDAVIDLSGKTLKIDSNHLNISANVTIKNGTISIINRNSFIGFDPNYSGSLNLVNVKIEVADGLKLEIQTDTLINDKEISETVIGEICSESYTVSTIDVTAGISYSIIRISNGSAS